MALIWADAIGLSVFCVIGAQAGLAAGAHWSIAILTGVMSAAFGGLLRDVILNDVPLILRAEIYALAALFGAGLYVLSVSLGLGEGVAAITGGAGRVRDQGMRHPVRLEHPRDRQAGLVQIVVIVAAARVHQR